MRKFFALLLIGVPALIFLGVLILMPAAFIYFASTGQAELAQAAAGPAGLCIAALLAGCAFAGFLIITWSRE